MKKFIPFILIVSLTGCMPMNLMEDDLEVDLKVEHQHPKR